MSEIVAKFSTLRTITENNEEIIIHGHCGVCGELPEEKFTKPEHRLHIDSDDNLILIFRD